MKNNFLTLISLIQKQRNIYIIPILIFIIFIYLPMFGNILTNWDDELYILYNPYLKNLSLDNLRKIFSTFYAGNYHPLTLLSLTADYKIGSSQLWAFQLTNLLLHLGNTVLVYLLVRSLIKLRFEEIKECSIIPVVAALLFGIHTYQVESVVWISERKNVLYAFFFLLSLLYYIKYIGNKSNRSYIFAIVLFIFSLLSKGMAVPLSLCIICIDYFAGRNLLSRKVILEKVPFLLLSLLFGIIAIFAQHSSNSLHTSNSFGILERMAFASYGFIQYLIKLCFPYHLSAFYPYPIKPGISIPYLYYAFIAFILLIFFILWKYFRHNKIVVFGMLFFIVNISIVIQLLPVGDAIMADRYVYISSIGFFIIIGYYSNVLWQKSIVIRCLTLFLLIIYSAVLGYKTCQRVGIWEDSITLWNDALKHYSANNDKAYLNRGNKFLELGNIQAALQDYESLLRIDPKNSAGYLGMSHVKYALSDWPGAMKDLNISLSLFKTYEAYISRAVLKMDMQDYSGALEDSDSAYRMNPYRSGTLINKGYIYLQTGDYNAALENYNHALRLDSHNSKAYKGRALVKKAMQDVQGALEDLDISLAINQTYDGYVERAVVKMALSNFEGAKSDLYAASQINPHSAEISINRGIIELNTGKYANALHEFNNAVEIDSSSSFAYLYRAIAKINLESYTAAIVDLNTSVSIQPNADAFFYRGIAYIRLNNKLKACSDLKEAIKMGNLAAKEELEKHCR